MAIEMSATEPSVTRFTGWHTSSYSQGNGGQCVEVGHASRTIGVRDSKNPAAGILKFNGPAWTAFLNGLH